MCESYSGCITLASKRNLRSSSRCLLRLALKTEIFVPTFTTFIHICFLIKVCSVVFLCPKSFRSLATEIETRITLNLKCDVTGCNSNVQEWWALTKLIDKESCNKILSLFFVYFIDFSANRKRSKRYRWDCLNYLA